MFPHGFFDPSSSKEQAPSKKNSKTPFACIKKATSKSYCERSVDENSEFMFTDAEYALRVYASGTMPIGVCDQCAHVCKVAGIGGKLSNAPLATRDLDKTKM